MSPPQFHLRTRPRMYLAVFAACSAVALMIDYLIPGPDDLNNGALPLPAVDARAVTAEVAGLPVDGR